MFYRAFVIVLISLLLIQFGYFLRGYIDLKNRDGVRFTTEFDAG